MAKVEKDRQDPRDQKEQPEVTLEDLDKKVNAILAKLRDYSANWKTFCKTHVGYDQDGKLGFLSRNFMPVLACAAIVALVSLAVRATQAPEAGDIHNWGVAAIRSNGDYDTDGNIVPSGDLTVGGDVTVTGADLTLAAAGVKLTGSDGGVTILGLGNGADESLIIDLDNGGANVITLSSGTLATTLDISAFTTLTVTQGSLTDSSILGADIRTNTIAANRLAAADIGELTVSGSGAVTIDSAVVDSDNIVNGSILGADIRTNTVAAANLAAADYGEITVSGSGAVTIDSGVVDSDNIVNGTIVAADIGDSELAALASVTSAANTIPYFSGAGTGAVVTSSANVLTLLAAANNAAIADIVLAAGTSGDLADGIVIDADIAAGAAIASSKLADEGVGTVNAEYATVSENGAGIYNQSLITITNDVVITLADGDHGAGTNLYTFPEGAIQICGVVMDGSVSNTAAFNASDNDHYSVGVGTVKAGDDNALSATEQDLIAVIDEDTSAGTILVHAEATILAASAIIDGTTTPLLVAFNAAIADTQNTGENSITLRAGSTIQVTWVNLGDK